MPAPASRLKTENGEYNQIGERLKARRRLLKLTQEDMCGRVALITNGVWNPDFREMSRLENGGRMVSDLEIICLAKVLDCSPCYLLMGSDSTTAMS